jgi:hypothetical protein
MTDSRQSDTKSRLDPNRPNDPTGPTSANAKPNLNVWSSQAEDSHENQSQSAPRISTPPPHWEPETGSGPRYAPNIPQNTNLSPKDGR